MLSLLLIFLSAFVIGFLIPLLAYDEQSERLTQVVASVTNYRGSRWPGAGQRPIAVCVSGGNMQVLQETGLSFRTYLVEVVGADVFAVANARAADLAQLGPTLVASAVEPSIATDFERRFRCLELVRAQERLRENKYKYVIATRPDFRYVLPHPIFSQLHHNNSRFLYTIHNRHYSPTPLEVRDKHFILPRVIADPFIVGLQEVQLGSNATAASLVSDFARSNQLDHLVLPSPFYLTCISGSSSTCVTDYLSNTLSEPLTYKSEALDMNELWGLRHAMALLHSHAIIIGDMAFAPYKSMSEFPLY
jgi:hypothetical protein